MLKFLLGFLFLPAAMLRAEPVNVQMLVDCRTLLGAHGTEAPPEAYEAWKKTEGLSSLMRILFGGEPRYEGDRSRLDESFENVWQSSEFKSFLARQGISRARKTRAKRLYYVSQYIDQTLGEYRNINKLEALQEIARSSRLVQRGVDVTRYKNSWEALEAVSKENVRPFLGSQEQIELPANDITFLHTLRVHYVHNSLRMKAQPAYPLLAPAELGKIGLGKFGLSTSLFHEMIGSDEQVYGFMSFVFPGAIISKESAYGKSGVILSDRYMRNHVMVSAWVMYPDELVAALEVIIPGYRPDKGTVESLKNLGKRNFFARDTLAAMKAQISPQLAHLHKLDFTPTDFESLVIHFLTKKLAKLRDGDRHRYDKIMGELRSGTLDPSDLISQALAQNLNGQWNFEGTVPIGIPDSELTYFKPRPRK